MLMFIIMIASAIWVYWDATKSKIGKIPDQSGFFNLSAGMWTTGSLLLWIVVFPAYVIKRSGLIETAKTNPIEASYRSAKLTTLSVVGGFLILSGLVGEMEQAELSGGFSSDNLPTIVFQEPADQLIQLDACEVIYGSIKCVMSYKLPQGEIVERSFVSTLYDQNGVKLDSWSFPDKRIRPGEKIKAPLLVYGNYSEIAKVVITAL